MVRSRVYRALVSRGYLPKEIPPAFTSESMLKFDVLKAVTLSKSHNLDMTERHPVSLEVPTVRGQRRRLKIPSPVAYARLSQSVGDHWKELSSLMDLSRVSLSRPVLNRNAHGRAFVDRFPAPNQRRIRMQRSRRASVTLYMDASNFYNSIYTHAIDWIVRGKATAKAVRNRPPATLGEYLDDRLQTCNDRQTSGIAIGPDASWVLAEVMMSRIDSELQGRFSWVRDAMVRYIDDVTLYAGSHEQALEVVEEYERLLGKYELAINSSKTRILSFVEPADPAWRSAVVRLVTRAATSGRPASLVSVLSEVLDEVNSRGDLNVLRYFLSSFHKSSLTKDTWGVLQDFLTMALRIDGMSVGHLHQLSLYAERKGLLSKYRDLEGNLHDYLAGQIDARHSYEVASVINLLTDLGRPVDTSHAEKALALENDFVDLLILEAASKVKRLRSVARSIEGRGADSGAFIDGRWLLAYEVQRQNPALRGAEFASGNWEQLAAAGVRFMRDPASSPASRWYLARLASRTHPSVYSARH